MEWGGVIYSPMSRQAGQSACGATVNRPERDHDGLAVCEPVVPRRFAAAAGESWPAPAAADAPVRRPATKHPSPGALRQPRRSAGLEKFRRIARILRERRSHRQKPIPSWLGTTGVLIHRSVSRPQIQRGTLYRAAAAQYRYGDVGASSHLMSPDGTDGLPQHPGSLVRHRPGHRPATYRVRGTAGDCGTALGTGTPQGMRSPRRSPTRRSPRRSGGSTRSRRAR